MDDTAALPLRTLLYRYFFFAWLFRDASRGSRVERAAAWHHNRRQARWLPTYLRRWLAAGALLFALGCVVELAFGAVPASALFYVPGALSVPADAVIAVAWVGLRVLPAPS